MKFEYIEIKKRLIDEAEREEDKFRNQQLKRIHKLFHLLSTEERKIIMDDFCKHCLGLKPCYCMRDE